MERFLLGHIASGNLCLGQHYAAKNSHVELVYMGPAAEEFKKNLKDAAAEYQKTHKDAKISLSGAEYPIVMIRKADALVRSLITAAKK